MRRIDDGIVWSIELAPLESARHGRPDILKIMSIDFAMKAVPAIAVIAFFGVEKKGIREAKHGKHGRYLCRHPRIHTQKHLFPCELFV